MFDDNYSIGFSIPAILGFILLVIGYSFGISLLVLLGWILTLIGSVMWINHLFMVLERIASWLR